MSLHNWSTKAMGKKMRDIGFVWQVDLTVDWMVHSSEYPMVKSG
jgi:hypothetical protein